MIGFIVIPEPALAQDSGTWTFIVYMSGDSSLSSNIPSDIQEMKEVGSSEKLNIIVLADSSGMDDTDLLRILPGGIEDIALSSVNSAWGVELNLGEPDILSQFVNWAAGNYPADHIMLDLWGHGNGWPGVCPDKGDYLSTAELGTAMKSISEAGIEIDILSVDACQMGMLEVAYEIRGCADYALLSQKDIPLDGWPYDDFLNVLGGNGTVIEKGQAMIDSYILWGRSRSQYSFTLSLIDLTGMEPLALALDEYARELTASAGFFNPEFIEARSLTEKYDGNAQYDLVHLLENIDNQTKYKSLEILSEELFSIISSSVVYENHFSNSMDFEKADHAHGLSIWFPSYDATMDYKTTSFAKDTGWPNFLDRMADYFQSPGRVQVSNRVDARPVDSDGDGLMDSIGITHDAQTYGVLTVEVYGPDGSLFSSEIQGADAGNYLIQLGSLGHYQVAFYLRDASGTLLNYALFDEGLAKEGVSEISGYVRSNTGRGLKWVIISLVNETGQNIKSTVTDGSGHYRIEVVVPTDTEGVGLQLVCGLGEGKTNATIGSLNATNSINFDLETSSQYIGWIVRAAGILNLAGIIALGCWAAFSRKKKIVPENK